MAKKNGAILYSGPSLLDGAPIVVIATGLAKGSSNTKTGAMIQTWIIRSDIAPHDATKSGADASICGDCPMRGTVTESGLKGRACYVKVFQAPLAVWRAYHRGNYEDWRARADWPELAGRIVRIGSYGDPAACPVDVWERYTEHAKRWTGYTHQWRHAQALAPFCMASVDSAAEAKEATRMGWRYFRVAPAGDTNADTLEVLCPASEEAGRKTTCENCGLCMGATSKARKSVMIPAHGAAKAYVTLR